MPLVATVREAAALHVRVAMLPASIGAADGDGDGDDADDDDAAVDLDAGAGPDAYTDSALVLPRGLVGDEAAGVRAVVFYHPAQANFALLAYGSGVLDVNGVLCGAGAAETAVELPSGSIVRIGEAQLIFSTRAGTVSVPRRSRC